MHNSQGFAETPPISWRDSSQDLGTQQPWVKKAVYIRPVQALLWRRRRRRRNSESFFKTLPLILAGAKDKPSHPKTPSRHGSVPAQDCPGSQR